MSSRIFNPAVESLGQADLAELQLRRLRAQVRRAAEAVPFYRDRWSAAVPNFSSLEEFRSQVPFTVKADFLQGLPEESGRLADGESIFQHHLTSGTTGLGQEVHPLSLADYETLGAGAQYLAYWAGIQPGDKVAWTFPVGLQAGGLASSAISAKVNLTALQLAPYRSEDKLRYLEMFQPAALVGSPSYIGHLTHLLHEQGRRPGDVFPGLRTIFICGENYTIEWAQSTREAWNCHIAEWYGMMQSGTNQAVSCERGVLTDDGKRGVLHSLDHRFLTEVLDPDTGDPVGPGEEGEVVMTTLTRDAFPLIRFRSDDKVKLADEPCPCGRAFLAIEAGTVSRYDDMMKVRGQNLWPASVDRVLLNHEQVVEYAGEVALEDGRETVRVQVELVPGFAMGDAPALLQDLEQTLKSVTNLSMQLRSAPPQSLPRFEFKAKRWTDQRRSGRATVRYVAGD